MKNITKQIAIIIISLLYLLIIYKFLNYIFGNKFYLDENNLLNKLLSLPFKKILINTYTIFLPLLIVMASFQVILYSLGKILQKDFKSIGNYLLRWHITLLTLQFIMLIFTEQQFNILISVISCYLIIDKISNKITLIK